MQENSRPVIVEMGSLVNISVAQLWFSRPTHDRSKVPNIINLFNKFLTCFDKNKTMSRQDKTHAPVGGCDGLPCVFEAFDSAFS